MPFDLTSAVDFVHCFYVAISATRFAEYTELQDEIACMIFITIARIHFAPDNCTVTYICMNDVPIYVINRYLTNSKRQLLCHDCNGYVTRQLVKFMHPWICTKEICNIIIYARHCLKYLHGIGLVWQIITPCINIIMQFLLHCDLVVTKSVSYKILTVTLLSKLAITRTKRLTTPLKTT